MKIIIFILITILIFVSSCNLIWPENSNSKKDQSITKTEISDEPIEPEQPPDIPINEPDEPDDLDKPTESEQLKTVLIGVGKFDQTILQ